MTSQSPLGWRSLKVKFDGMRLSLSLQFSFLINENIISKHFCNCLSFINSRISPLIEIQLPLTVLINHYFEPEGQLNRIINLLYDVNASTVDLYVARTQTVILIYIIVIILHVFNTIITLFVCQFMG